MLQVKAEKEKVEVETETKKPVKNGGKSK